MIHFQENANVKTNKVSKKKQRSERVEKHTPRELLLGHSVH